MAAAHYFQQGAYLLIFGFDLFPQAIAKGLHRGAVVILQVCVLATLTTLLGDYGGGFFNHGASAKQEPAEGDVRVYVGNGCNGVE